MEKQPRLEMMGERARHVGRFLLDAVSASGLAHMGLPPDIAERLPETQESQVAEETHIVRGEE